MAAPTAPQPPAPPAPSGYALSDLDALVEEVGASYPLLGWVAEAAQEDYEDESALDPLIFAGLVSP